MLEKPPPIGRGHRTLQRDPGALDGLGQVLGNVLVIFFVGVGAGGEALPLELDAGGFQNANGSRWITSGPIPSPGINVTLWLMDIIFSCCGWIGWTLLALSILPRRSLMPRPIRPGLSLGVSLCLSRSFSSLMNSCTSLKSR